MNVKIFAAACALGLTTAPAALLAQQAEQGQQSPALAGAELPPAELTEEGKEFIKKAAEGNLAEVLLAGAAKTSAGSPNVRQFAERLLDDHAATNQKLSNIAERHGVTWPQGAPQEAQDFAARLNEMSPEEFDTAYMEKMVKDHEKDVKEYREAQEKVQNPELKGYIDTTLEILEAHLVLARAIRDGANVEDLGPEVQGQTQAGREAR